MALTKTKSSILILNKFRHCLQKHEQIHGYSDIARMNNYCLSSTSSDVRLRAKALLTNSASLQSSCLFVLLSNFRKLYMDGKS